MWYEKLGGRKMAFGVLVVVVSMVLSLTGTLASAQWVQVIEVLVVSLMAGNAIEHVAKEKWSKK